MSVGRSGKLVVVLAYWISLSLLNVSGYSAIKEPFTLPLRVAFGVE
jgi:hypothetical protein